MVYWRDIPSDANYTSPYANYGPSPKYLTFEPDEGGWNNIRMSMETATALAVAMGRILGKSRSLSTTFRMKLILYQQYYVLSSGHLIHPFVSINPSGVLYRVTVRRSVATNPTHIFTVERSQEQEQSLHLSRLLSLRCRRRRTPRRPCHFYARLSRAQHFS